MNNTGTKIGSIMK